MNHTQTTDTLRPAPDTRPMTAEPDTDLPLDPRQGRPNPYPFAQVPEWVLFADVSPGAKLLYAILCAHINTRRTSRTMWPSTATLAALMGNVTDRTIRRYLRELEGIGAITVTERFKAHGGQDTNLVEAHEVPEDPMTYAGIKSVQEAHARLKTRHPAAQGGRTQMSGGGGHRCPGGLLRL